MGVGLTPLSRWPSVSDSWVVLSSLTSGSDRTCRLGLLPWIQWDFWSMLSLFWPALCLMMWGGGCSRPRCMVMWQEIVSMPLTLSESCEHPLSWPLDSGGSGAALWQHSVYRSHCLHWSDYFGQGSSSGGRPWQHPGGEMGARLIAQFISSTLGWL